MQKKIISYNVNGIRAAMRKEWLPWLKTANPDIICLQEVKANEDQFESHGITELGYHHYWYPAEKKGYSGVAILTKEKPLHVEYGCGIKDYDDEGRIIRADYEEFSIISVYMPSGSSGDERQAFKLQFLKDFKNYIQSLTDQFPKLIISGDFNICHQAIDIHNPVRNANTSGFTIEEREWVTQFLNDGFIDSFRKFNLEPDQYSWWSYRANARSKNLGWRIDYHMVSQAMEKQLLSAGILKNAHHSDHCPVLVNIEV